ncbi:MAG TPA: hypothetical protein V6C81_22235 [Planktothrix sp.]|jgi:hypothetical protein
MKRFLELILQFRKPPLSSAEQFNASSSPQSPLAQPPDREQVRHQNAKLSYARLRALTGFGHRQCYLPKLRDEAHTGADPDLWSDGCGKHQVDLEVSKRQDLARAKANMSYTRLAALVDRMDPEEVERNTDEGRRLQGSGWDIPKLPDDYRPK